MAEVQRAVTDVLGEPDEEAVHGVDGVVDRECGLTGQVAGTLFVDEAVLGGHPSFIRESGGRTERRRAGKVDGGRSSPAEAKRRRLGRWAPLSPSPGLGASIHNVHYPKYQIP